MKKAATILCAMLLGLGLNATEPVVIPLWSSECPAPTPQQIIGPQADDGIGHLTNISTPELIVYRPDKHKNSGAAVMICPGGGYGVVSMRYEGHAYAKLLADNGITAAILKYRLPGEVHTVSTEDATRGMEIIHAKAAEWGVDPHKIGISGASAGGHLAAATATHALRANQRAYFMILLYPVVTFSGEATHSGSRWGLTGGDRTLDHFYSPEQNITPSTPPTLVIVSLDDQGVSTENSRMIIDSLSAKGIPSTLVRFPSGGHGWGFNPDFEHAAARDSATLKFIRNLTQY